MVIYATGYTRHPLQWTSPSTDSGFRSIDEVVSMMGDGYYKRTGGWVIYRNGNKATIFSRTPLFIDPNDNRRYLSTIKEPSGGSESCSG